MKWTDWGLTVVLILVGVAVVVFNNSGTSDEIVRTKTPDRSKYCRSIRGEQSARLDECVAEISKVSLSSDAKVLIEGLMEAGAIMTVADRA